MRCARTRVRGCMCRMGPYLVALWEMSVRLKNLNVGRSHVRELSKQAAEQLGELFTHHTFYSNR